jgi:4-amino-4-deoxy-L-arabinose transferase-like glycosyltransferase
MASSSKKVTLVYFILLALLVIVLRLPAFNQLLDTDSSANAFFARQMLRGEILYDKFHPAHHLPGIYYTFVLAFKLFGDNPVAPQLLLLPIIFICAWLIFLMGRSFFDDFTGMLSAFFYVLGSSQVYLSGMTVEMEQFANLPLIATMLVFLILMRKNARPLQFAGVGVLSAICILYKITFVAPLAAAGIASLINIWLERNQTDSWEKALFRISSVTVGLMLPLILVAVYFASMGLWHRLILIFTFGLNYFNDAAQMGDLIFPRPFGYPLFIIGMNNSTLLIIGLFGTYRLVHRALPLRTQENLTDFTLAVWLVISFALTGMRGGGFFHYVLVVIPPLALASGVEISSAYKRWQTTKSNKQAFIGASIMAVLITVNFLWRNYDLYRQYYIPNKSGQEFSYQSSHEDRQTAVINYIKSNTTPDDFIYVWGINMHLYYYADRLPPIDILWPSYISATGPPERIFNARTKYIIVDNAQIFFRPQWLIDELEPNYHLETIINGMEIYRRSH